MCGKSPCLDGCSLFKVLFRLVFQEQHFLFYVTNNNSTFSTLKVIKKFIIWFSVYFRYCHNDNECWLSLVTRLGQHLSFSNLGILDNAENVLLGIFLIALHVLNNGNHGCSKGLIFTKRDFKPDPLLLPLLKENFENLSTEVMHVMSTSRFEFGDTT